MIVVDASAALSTLLNSGPARRAMGDQQLHAPHLIDTDVRDNLSDYDACYVALAELLGCDLPPTWTAGDAVRMTWAEPEASRRHQSLPQLGDEPGGVAGG